MLGYMPAESNEPTTVFSEEDLPTWLDWRAKGAVTRVKDQGQCGSCWAFSTTGSLEGAHFIAERELESFSEQQLVDCARGATSNHGCNGGNPLWAFKYLKGNQAERESSYPYTSGTTRVHGTCA